MPYVVKVTGFSRDTAGEYSVIDECHVWEWLFDTREAAVAKITIVNHEAFPDHFRGTWTDVQLTSMTNRPAGFSWEDPVEGLVEYEIVEVQWLFDAAVE